MEVFNPFYCANDPDGILCNSNAEAQNYANAISTKIMLPLDLKDSSSNTEPDGSTRQNETDNSHPSKLLCEIILICRKPVLLQSGFCYIAE